MTTLAQNRLKGYLRTFIVMSACGLLLMTGGGSFFIYESIKFSNEAKSDDDYAAVEQHSNRSSSSSTHHHRDQSSHPLMPHRNPDEATRHRAYASELRIIGFVFLGTGFLLFVFGLLFACQFWKRYQQSKDTERYPIVEASAPEQSLLARHNWRKTNSNNDHFENPISLKAAETRSNEESLELREGAFQTDDEIIITRNSSQPYKSMYEQNSFNNDHTSSKRSSLFDKLFAITDDDVVPNVTDKDENIFESATAN